MWGFTAASLAGGAPPHSLHLTALVQLVKEIPEFLFGEVNPESESGGAGLDGERASPEGKSDSGHCIPQDEVQAASCVPAQSLPDPRRSPWLTSPGSTSAPLKAWVVGETVAPDSSHGGFYVASATPHGPVASCPAWQLRPVPVL